MNYHHEKCNKNPDSNMDVDMLLDPSYHYCRSHSSFHPRLRLRRRLHPPILKMITVSAYHLIIIYSIILSNLQYCNAFLQGISTSVKTTSSSVRVTNSFPSRFAQHKNASTGNCASTDMSTLAQRREYRNKSFMTSLRSNSSSELDAASISESNEVIAAVSSMELGDPVDLKYTEYYDGVENDGSMDHDHDPVILLHGLLGQKRNFASLATSLSTQLEKKRKIYALDLRNHGDNHHDWRDEMSYTDMCHDVLAFMDKMNLQNAVLIGHSMGGKVAKSLALSHPQRISGLVVLDIAPVRYTEKDVAWKAVKGIIDSLKHVTIDEPGMTKRTIDQNLRSTVEDPALRAFVLTNLDEDREEKIMRWKININSISSQLDVIAGFDVNQNELNGGDGSRYEGDTFFINGGTSSFVKGSHMSLISEYFPNYMLTTIRGSGHWVHAEAPDDTLALLKRYLDR